MLTQQENNLPLNICSQKAWLAPLAGYSDLTFRLLCREFGANIACTEMVSAKGLVYNSNGTHDLLRTTALDSQINPLIVQLFGSEIPFMEQALQMLLAQGFCYFDLNMGCPVPKVNKSGAGAAMLKNVNNTLALAKAMLNLTNKGCMGFKMRLGWTDDSHVWQDLALGLQELGASWITLHPRTAKQGFRGEANWEYLAKLKSILHIPLIASGDLFTAYDGVNCIKQTGVDTVMYARGAMQNPAIFEEHSMLMSGQSIPPINGIKLLRIIHKHMELAQDYSNERIILLKMRTFIPRYLHHFPGVKRLRHDISLCKSFSDLDTILQNFFAA